LIQNEDGKCEVSKYTDTGSDTGCMIAKYFGSSRLDSRKKETTDFTGGQINGLSSHRHLLLGAA
jgi:hypothetical protein